MLEHPELRQQYLKQLPPQDWYQQSAAASAFAAGARRSRARSASRLISFMVLTFLGDSDVGAPPGIRPRAVGGSTGGVWTRLGG